MLIFVNLCINLRHVSVALHEVLLELWYSENGSVNSQKFSSIVTGSDFTKFSYTSIHHGARSYLLLHLRTNAEQVWNSTREYADQIFFNLKKPEVNCLWQHLKQTLMASQKSVTPKDKEHII